MIAFGTRVRLLDTLVGDGRTFTLPAGSEGTVSDPFANPEEDPTCVVFDALPGRPGHPNGLLVELRLLEEVTT